MSTIIRTERIQCDNDCNQGGCSSHEMQLEFQTTANIYTIKKDGATIRCMDRSEMRSILRMLKSMNHRVEVEEDCKKCLNHGEVESESFQEHKEYLSNVEELANIFKQETFSNIQICRIWAKIVIHAGYRKQECLHDFRGGSCCIHCGNINP